MRPCQRQNAMLSRALTVALAGVSALCIASGALAANEPILAPPKPLLGKPVLAKPRPAAVAAKPKAKPAAPAPVEVAAEFPVYDSIIDPETAAIRLALANAGTEGSFLDKRDAAGVA